MRTLDSLNIENKKVLLRVDYNVPLDENGDIVDDYRIKLSLPTIKFLLKKAKQIIIITHLGRPEGKFNKKFTLDKVAVKLMKYVGRQIPKLSDCIDVDMPNDKIVLLENLRFHPEEENNDIEFAKKLAKHADVYVNDAFSVSHREHASIVGIPKFLPSCAGKLIEKEVHNLDFKNAKKPFCVIMGGSKLSTKFQLINSLLPKVDYLILGGAMVFTFLKAKGIEIGKSKYEKDQAVTAKLLLNNDKIILPKKIVIAKKIDDKAKTTIVDFDKIPKTGMGVDNSIEEFKPFINKCKTVFWNGPMGIYEVDNFAKGSKELAKFLASCDANVIAGGGDSIAIIDELKLRDFYHHVSSGGGASLSYMKNGKLVGLEVLKN